MSAATIPVGHGVKAWWGPRRTVLLAIFLGGLFAAWAIDLKPSHLWQEAQWHQLGRFFSAALQPALVYEDGSPVAEDPFLAEIFRAMYVTVAYAGAAISVALCGGILFGLAGSAKTWLALATPREGRRQRWFRGGVLAALWVVRGVMTVLRSVHEIVWAILFLQALGTEPLAAVMAIAIPYSATLGKVFSELIDETPRATAQALRHNGASVLQVYCFGLFPAVLPDLLAYLLYRFECSLRSAAVLGFFGIQTLGHYLSLSWGERHYHEVWSYLYALLLLIVLFDYWSGAVRQRLTTQHGG
jgi:phosphonate transport system permease protein